MSTALYRRYRPETFADVIGQEHVTEPLMAAIDKNRINHAYLFSGPRGCGKTTSARILARCLNCAQGPTSTPCGTCDSCVELARNGSGSLDVIEIDAASHGGVDDARDLRERATFAPVRDRFKIFIIDEAHMVTSAGFNALLKIVEEPPEHILFIFATTEPDKVIGTIRSRTHHYPFRLVPPEPLMAYLELLCRQENVPVAPGVLSLVIRAGGGSVRDSLSVLDQLMAGAGENGLDYELAVSLLGYTHATLLDDVVESVAAGDAGTVFNAVDRVIQTGHDPRRFVEDLLERFRDLIVINAVPEGAASILRGVPDDQLNRMRSQANQLGAGELSRSADVTNTALTEMTGATSPRLHLELLCARLLLPAADATVRGTLARVDRIERRLEYAGGTPAPEAEETPKAPARPRLDVPRTAEEAAARWSLPAADPAAPAVAVADPGTAPDPSSPAVPVAARVPGPGGGPVPADSSPDWGGSWGVSTDSAFAGPGATKGGAPQEPAAGGPPRASNQSDAVPAVPSAAAPAAPAFAAPTGQPGRTADTEDDADTAAPGVPDAASDRRGQPSAPAPLGAPEHDGGRAPAADAARDRQPSGAGQSAPDRTRRPGATDGPAGDAPVRGSQDAPSWGAPSRPQGTPQQTPQQGRPQQAPQDVPQTGRPQVDPAQTGEGRPQQEARRADQGQGQPPAPGASGGNVEMIRRAWPEIMDEVARIKRATWLIVNVSAKPRSFEGNQLVLAFANQGTAIGFQRGPHVDNVKQAIHKVLGLTCSIEAVHDAGGAGESGPKVPASQAAPGSNPGLAPAVPPPGRGGPDGRPNSSSQSPAPPAVGLPAHRSAVVADEDAPSPGTRTSLSRDDAQAAAPSAVGRSGHGTSPAASAPAPTDGPAASGPVPGQAAPPAAPSSSSPGTAGGRASSTTGAPSRSGSHPAARSDALRSDVRSYVRSDAAPTPDAEQGTRPDAAVRRDDARPTGTRTTGGTGRPAASTGPAVPEAVGAWDPSMSDDSWALVEPPEDAFDPGSDVGSVPEDPYDHRPQQQRGAAGAHPAGTPSVARGNGPGTVAPASAGGSASAPQRARSTAPGAHAAGNAQAGNAQAGEVQAGAAPAVGPAHAGAPHAGAARATAPAGGPAAAAAPPAEPQRSRSVVWSPPVAEAPPASPGTPSSPAPAQPRGLTGSAGMPDQASSRGTAGSITDGSVATTGPIVPAAPARGGSSAAPDPSASAGNVRQKPISRYQQLLDEAERKRAEEAAAARGAVDLRFVEDEPSADDETIEESGLVGRTAIERILNGRLVEERSIDGQ